MASRSSSTSAFPIHVSGIEGVAAEGETTVAEDLAHPEPLAADEKAADEADGDDLGKRQPRIGRRHYSSKKAEVEEHNPFHVHSFSWCPSCVAGRSTSKQHRRQSAYEEGMGRTMSVDYAFKFAEEVDEKTAPALVAYEHKTRSLWVLEVDHKGVDSGIAPDLLVGK